MWYSTSSYTSSVGNCLQEIFLYVQSSNTEISQGWLKGDHSIHVNKVTKIFSYFEINWDFILSIWLKDYVDWRSCLKVICPKVNGQGIKDYYPENMHATWYDQHTTVLLYGRHCQWWEVMQMIIKPELSLCVKSGLMYIQMRIKAALIRAKLDIKLPQSKYTEDENVIDPFNNFCLMQHHLSLLWSNLKYIQNSFWSLKPQNCNKNTPQ